MSSLRLLTIVAKGGAFSYVCSFSVCLKSSETPDTPLPFPESKMAIVFYLVFTHAEDKQPDLLNQSPNDYICDLPPLLVPLRLAGGSQADAIRKQNK